MMVNTPMVLAVGTLLMAMSAIPTASALFLDDFTDFDANALRLLPRGNMWQTFTPGWDSMLGELRVYTGTEDHCVPSNATLYLSEGEPTSISDVKGNTIADPVTITTTCDDNDVVCVDKMPNKQCASWQRFIFDDPIALQQGAKYTFALEVEPSHYNLHPVMGVSPEAKNHGGASSLAVSPMFKTRYAQYTFQTYMTTSDPSGSNLNEQPRSSTGQPSTGVEGNSSGDKSGSGGVSAAGIAVPVVLVLVLVAAAVFVVVQRRRWTKDKVVDGLQLNSLGPDDDDAAERNSLNSHQDARYHSRNRHPINVRAATQDGSHEDRQRWADQTWAYGTYTRRLPSLPTETQC